MDLKYSQANMLEADVALTAGDAGGDLIGGPIWGFTLCNTALSLLISAVLQSWVLPSLPKGIL